jgi:hypothetical protein
VNLWTNPLPISEIIDRLSRTRNLRKLSQFGDQKHSLQIIQLNIREALLEEDDSPQKKRESILSI